MDDAGLQSAVFGLSEVHLRHVRPTERATRGFRNRPAARSQTPRPQEQLRLHVVRHGGLVIDSGDVSLELTAGDAAFLLSSAAGELRSGIACELLTIAVPVEVLGDVRAVWPASGVQRVPRESMLLPPVAAFAARMLEGSANEVSGFTSYYVERLLQEMLQGLLLGASRAARVPQTQTTFPLAISVIVAQHSDPELTAVAIAEEVNISLRQLEREFRKRGTTIRRELRRVRVEQARKMLGDPDYAGLSITQIAQFVGFSSGSSLARAMSAVGLPAPSAVRV